MSLPTEDIFIHAISHEIRRQILRLVRENPKSFTELLSYFDISSSKLTYHLKLIHGFIAKEENQTYSITQLGQRAIIILDSIGSNLSPAEPSLLKEAYQSQKNSGSSLFFGGINLAIGVVIFAIFISITIGIIAGLDPQTPWIIYPIELLIIGLEFALLIWLLKVRKNTPPFLMKLKKHIDETP